MTGAQWREGDAEEGYARCTIMIKSRGWRDDQNNDSEGEGGGGGGGDGEGE